LRAKKQTRGKGGREEEEEEEEDEEEDDEDDTQHCDDDEEEMGDGNENDKIWKKKSNHAQIHSAVGRIRRIIEVGEGHWTYLPAQ
jgi:hypothetical protein